MLGSGVSYSSPEGLVSAQAVVLQLASAIVSLGPICFLLPVKLSRVFIQKDEVFFVAGLPLSLLLQPFASVARPAANALPTAAVKGKTATPAVTHAAIPGTESSFSARSAQATQRTAEKPAAIPVERLTSAAAPLAQAGAHVQCSFISSLRIPTAAADLWAEDFCCCLPPECVDNSDQFFCCPETVDKAHAWMLGLLLLRIIAGADRFQKRRRWGAESQQQIYTAVSQVGDTRTQVSCS